MRAHRSIVCILCLAAAAPAAAQRVREHTRRVRRGRIVTQQRAEALTLTVAAVSSRFVQTWVRVAGTIDKTNKILTGERSRPNAALVKVGQRVRAFSPTSKSSMYQAFVTRVVPRAGGATAEATLAATGRLNTTLYVIEIVVELGPFLSVPNEAIIEEGDQHIVYVQQASGEYAPREIHIGMQGELYTQVMDGVKEGEQVVTFGSFFIDADHKLKGTG